MVEPLFLQSTSSLASSSCLYPVDIEVPHHQLRNFISTTYKDKIFYVNKYDIFVLDLASRQRSIVVTVPFEARCLAAAHGWVCVGGEARGDCAFVNIGEENGSPGTFCHELLVESVGSEIVNSLTIQLLKPEFEEQQEEVVVLLSNNDKTVTIYSLTQRSALASIEHPKSMNYAVLSPDTTIMAAVGDENKVYFLKRSQYESSSDSQGTISVFPIYNWRSMAEPDLPLGTPIVEDFCFAITFSPNGKWCAVSSQGGCITIFDMDAIEQKTEPVEEAIVCTFRSSRASLWGCVRSMAFSPKNWDLLAWAEDHGRIGIADVRQGYLRRQHCSLKQDEFRVIKMEDQLPEEWKEVDVKDRLSRQHQQRMQALRGHPPRGARSFRDSTNRVTNLIPTSDPNVLATPTDTNSPGSSGGEGEPVQSDPTVQPYSINYGNTRPRVNPSASTSGLRRDHDVQLLNTVRPRRRSSVVLSPSRHTQQLGVPGEISRAAMTASPAPMSEDPLPPLMSTNDLTPSVAPSSQPLPYNIPRSESSHTIEADLARARASHSTATWTEACLSDVESSIIAERQLLNRVDRHLEAERRLSGRLAADMASRERLQASRTNSQSSTNEQMSSLDLLIHRQLLTERDNGDRRVEELEIESRELRRRINELQVEGTILLRQHANRQQDSRNTPTSASTSHASMNLIEEDLQLRQRLHDMNIDRRARTERLYGFEQDLRRAQSSVDLTLLQNSSHQSTTASPSSTITRAEPRNAPNHAMSIATPDASSVTSANRRVSEIVNPAQFQSPIVRILQPRILPNFVSGPGRATLPRPLEPPTSISDDGIRMTRMLFARHSADGNGNFSPAAFQMFILGPASQAEGMSTEEAMRDSGVGTAGIGWSPDGLKLFVGSRVGIFEFDLNICDRLQSPIIEVR